MSASIGRLVLRAMRRLPFLMVVAGTAPGYVVVNTASLFWESGTGWSRGLVTSSTTFTVTDGPLLSLVKSASATDLGPGQDAVFTLSVANSGGDTAYGVVVLDTLPALLAFRPGTATAAADPGWAPAPGPPEVLRWTVGQVGPGAVRTIQLTVRAGAPGADTVVANRAITHYGAAYGIPMPPELATLPVTVRAALPPAAPGTLSAVGLTAGVRLGWTAAVAGNRAVSGYNVYRAAGSPVVPGVATFVALVPGAAVTTFTDGGLAPGTTYCYVLRAVDVAGQESPDSAEACALTSSVAPAVTITKLLTGPASVKAGELTSFTLIVQNSGTDTAYGVVVLDTLPALLGFAGMTAGAAPDGGWSPESSLANERVRWTITELGVAAGANNVVLSFDAKGRNPGGSPVTAANDAVVHFAAAGGVPMPPDYPPTLPSVTVNPTALPGSAAPLTALAAGGLVALGWSPAAAGDFPVSGYNIYRSTSAGFAPGPATFLIQSTGALTSTLADAAVPPGSGWVWVVRAVDVLGNEGPVTNEAAAGLFAPAAPAALTARLVGAGIALGWQPAAAGSSPVSAYLVYRSSASGFAPVAGTLLATATVTTYTDAAPPPGTPWFYLVRATDGFLAGPASNQAFATVPGTVVIPPPTPPPADLTVRMVVTVFDASGRAVRTVADRMVAAAATLVGTEAAPASLGSVTFILSDGTRLVWDGRETGGAVAANGLYTVRVTDRLADGRESISTASFAFVRPWTDVIEDAALVPNPATESVWLSWRLAVAATSVDIRIYGVSGELVFHDAVPGTARSFRWMLRNAEGRRVSDGIYLVVLDAADPAGGTRDRKMLKLAVTRP